MTLLQPVSRATPAPLTDSEKIAWLRLSRTDNVGPITFYRLLEMFGTASKAIDALPTLSKRGGRLKALTPLPSDDAEREYDALHKLGGSFIFAADANYPLALSALEDTPPVLSILGNRAALNQACLGIVGARNASLNGRKFAEKISRDLGQAGQIIVSGLARGIDTSAHQGALATGTIAVVAGGLDIIYPQENTQLYHQIHAQGGAIVAESPLGMEPLARHFPRRNRIVSGLSSGIVVVEATFKSGSLITARLAAEQGRDVYAVPGHPFDPRAEGPNKLIQDGATLVRNAEDVLKNIHGFKPSIPLHEPPQTPWNPDLAQGLAYDENDAETIREIILENISSSPTPVDELVRSCQLTITAVQGTLLELELAGRLQRLPGNRVVLIN